MTNDLRFLYFILKFLWWNFLIWISLFLLKILIALTPILPNLISGAELARLEGNVHMIAVIVLTFIYLPIKTFIIGYKTLQTKCPGCKAIYRYTECSNCGNSKFLDDQCMACGALDNQIADTTCDDCGTRGLKYRAK
jgi:hypothetical protein